MISSETLSKTGMPVLLVLAWLLPGLIGHDPWKPDEAYTFGVVYHFLLGGDFIVPTLAGEPFLENPPLYYLTAALFAKIFSPLLPLHDAARLASGFYLTLTLLFVGLAGRELSGKNQGWVAVLIMIGCLGLLVRAHQLISDTGMLAGLAASIYSLALCLRRPVLAGLVLGSGAGIGFMSKGIIAPVMMGAAVLLLLLFEAWRNRGYALCLLTAAIASLPWLALWPLAFYEHSPELFSEWLWVYSLSRLPGFADTASFANTAYYFLKTLLWFAWPAWPLALWTLWQGGLPGLRRPAIQIPLLVFVVMMCLLCFTPDPNDVDTLPLLLPLCLLAAAGLDTLRRGAAAALDWFGIMTFGLIAFLIWLGWISLLTGHPEYFARQSKYFRLTQGIDFSLLAFLIAFIVTGSWFALVSRIGRSNRRAIINWAGGITMIWVLAMTLWLPWLDSFKSYRSMAASLRQALPSPRTCLASQGLGSSQRAMLHYFAGILTRRVEVAKTEECDLLLVQGTGQEPAVSPEPQWKKIWEGHRLADRDERYRLYQRTGANPRATKNAG